METMPQTAAKTAFTSVSRPMDTPEELDARAAQLKAEADAIREAKKAQVIQEAEIQKEENVRKLTKLTNDLKNLDEALKLAGKLTLDEARSLSVQRTHLEGQIAELQIKLGIIQQTETLEFEIPKKVKVTTEWPTVAKITALLFACWGIVIYSGDWILEKYPNAAIYNDVSFQKVLFGFSVFIAAIASVILALTVFFPGLSKYFNPFNRDELDFYNDFKTLDQWQRCIISVALFFALLLCFVLTVSGKLD